MPLWIFRTHNICINILSLGDVLFRMRSLISCPFYTLRNCANGAIARGIEHWNVSHIVILSFRRNTRTIEFVNFAFQEFWWMFLYFVFDCDEHVALQLWQYTDVVSHRCILSWKRKMVDGHLLMSFQFCFLVNANAIKII